MIRPDLPFDAAAKKFFLAQFFGQIFKAIENGFVKFANTPEVKCEVLYLICGDWKSREYSPSAFPAGFQSLVFHVANLVQLDDFLFGPDGRRPLNLQKCCNRLFRKPL